jgi:3-isopropylmalate/(R)-2-methylmalate dehydratase small subunit
MEEILRGKVAIILGDFVNSDQMTPPQYVWQLHDPEVAARVCLTNFDPDFPRKVRPGDFIATGRGFGYGHLHMGVLKGFQKLGVAAIIAESCVSSWYRGAISSGFPVIICSDITKKASQGDELEIEVTTGVIKNLTSQERFKAEPIPPLLREILNAGGMEAYTNQKLSSD